MEFYMQTLMRKNKCNVCRLSGAAARTGDKNIKVIENNVEIGIFKSAIKRRNINIMITSIEQVDSGNHVDEKRLCIL